MATRRAMVSPRYPTGDAIHPTLEAVNARRVVESSMDHDEHLLQGVIDGRGRHAQARECPPQTIVKHRIQPGEVRRGVVARGDEQGHAKDQGARSRPLPSPKPHLEQDRESNAHHRRPLEQAPRCPRPRSRSEVGPPRSPARDPRQAHAAWRALAGADAPEPVRDGRDFHVSVRGRADHSRVAARRRCASCHRGARQRSPRRRRSVARAS